MNGSKSRGSYTSPRAKAHPMKKSNKKFKKLISKTADHGSYIDAELSENFSVSSGYSVPRLDNRPVNNQMMHGSVDNTQLLRLQLSETLEENAIIKSRLHMELKERHALEVKNRDLSDKLLDAKRGLHETGTALYKVQQATDQLMNKRDQREAQLQRALEANRAYEAKISEMELQMGQLDDTSKLQSAIANYRRIISEKDEVIQTLEDQQVAVQNQLSKSKRENNRLAEEVKDLEFMLETKQKKIKALENQVRLAADEYSSVLGSPVGGAGSSAPGSPRTPGHHNGAAVDNNTVVAEMTAKFNEMKLMEMQKSVFDNEKAALEERMRLLEQRLNEGGSLSGSRSASKEGNREGGSRSRSTLAVVSSSSKGSGGGGSSSRTSSREGSRDGRRSTSTTKNASSSKPADDDNVSVLTAESATAKAKKSSSKSAAAAALTNATTTTIADTASVASEGTTATNDAEDKKKSRKTVRTKKVASTENMSAVAIAAAKSTDLENRSSDSLFAASSVVAITDNPNAFDASAPSSASAAPDPASSKTKKSKKSRNTITTSGTSDAGSVVSDSVDAQSKVTFAAVEKQQEPVPLTKKKSSKSILKKSAGDLSSPTNNAISLETTAESSPTPPVAAPAAASGKKSPKAASKEKTTAAKTLSAAEPTNTTSASYTTAATSAAAAPTPTPTPAVSSTTPEATTSSPKASAATKAKATASSTVASQVKSETPEAVVASTAKNTEPSAVTSTSQVVPPEAVKTKTPPPTTAVAAAAAVPAAVPAAAPAAVVPTAPTTASSDPEKLSAEAAANKQRAITSAEKRATILAKTVMSNKAGTEAALPGPTANPRVQSAERRATQRAASSERRERARREQEAQKQQDGSGSGNGDAAATITDAATKGIAVNGEKVDAVAASDGASSAPAEKPPSSSSRTSSRPSSRGRAGVVGAPLIKPSSASTSAKSPTGGGEGATVAAAAAAAEGQGAEPVAASISSKPASASGRPKSAEMKALALKLASGETEITPESRPQTAEDTEALIKRLTVEKKAVKKDIYSWSKEFVNKNSREPTKEEREALCKDKFKRYRQINKALKDLGGGGGDEDEENGKSMKFSKSTKVAAGDAAESAKD